ncbi:peptide deformylase [Gammaproteobacteria bacterium 42_54_T18]|nr:peptide deformylase [Gammaproteobacteria bacterium 42_54_T18]
MSKARVGVAELGNPILRVQAEKVVSFAGSGAETSRLLYIVEQMREVMQDRDGVGIAAPQIGISQQILIIASRPNERYPEAPFIEPVVMINPIINSKSSQTEKGWEGCLSVPGIRGYVSRAVQVNVSFVDMDGAPQCWGLEGFPARIFLHEYDHLIGLTFLDRIDSVADLISENELAKR